VSNGSSSCRCPRCRGVHATAGSYPAERTPAWLTADMGLWDMVRRDISWRSRPPLCPCQQARNGIGFCRSPHQNGAAARAHLGVELKAWNCVDPSRAFGPGDCGRRALIGDVRSVESWRARRGLLGAQFRPFCGRNGAILPMQRIGKVSVHSARQVDLRRSCRIAGTDAASWKAIKRLDQTTACSTDCCNP
jgi:hypothetical protein